MAPMPGTAICSWPLRRFGQRPFAPRIRCLTQSPDAPTTPRSAPPGSNMCRRRAAAGPELSLNHVRQIYSHNCKHRWRIAVAISAAMIPFVAQGRLSLGSWLGRFYLHSFLLSHRLEKPRQVSPQFDSPAGFGWRGSCLAEVCYSSRRGRWTPLHLSSQNLAPPARAGGVFRSGGTVV